MTTELLDAAPSPQAIDRAALLARKDVLAVEMRRVAKVDEARIAAERRLADLADEADAIDDAEKSAWREWIAKPTAGAAPAPLSERRADLARRRVAAADDVAGALTGSVAVQERRRELTAELRGINRELRRLTIGDVLEEAKALCAQQVELGERLEAVTHDRFGLIAALQRETAAAVARNDRSLADELARAADGIIGLPAPEMQRDGMKVEERAGFWRGKLA